MYATNRQIFSFQSSSRCIFSSSNSSWPSSWSSFSSWRTFLSSLLGSSGSLTRVKTTRNLVDWSHWSILSNLNHLLWLISLLYITRKGGVWDSFVIASKFLQSINWTRSEEVSNKPILLYLHRWSMKGVTNSLMMHWYAFNCYIQKFLEWCFVLIIIGWFSHQGSDYVVLHPHLVLQKKWWNSSSLIL